MIKENYTLDDKIQVEKETENQLNSFMKKLHLEILVLESQNETSSDFEKIYILKMKMR